jgi:hypothetical protein
MMTSRCARLSCVLGVLSVFAFAGVSEARADQIAMACVWDSNNSVKSTYTIDLQNKTVTNSADKTYPILELTDTYVKWHETDANYSGDDELNRISGALTANLVIGGNAVTWTYTCQRVQKQF